MAAEKLKFACLVGTLVLVLASHSAQASTMATQSDVALQIPNPHYVTVTESIEVDAACQKQLGMYRALYGKLLSNRKKLAESRSLTTEDKRTLVRFEWRLPRVVVA